MRNKYKPNTPNRVCLFNKTANILKKYTYINTKFLAVASKCEIIFSFPLFDHHGGKMIIFRCFIERSKLSLIQKSNTRSEKGFFRYQWKLLLISVSYIIEKTTVLSLLIRPWLDVRSYDQIFDILRGDPAIQ